ncbi:MAG: ATP-binding protein [Pseudomonadota bacterium]
MARVTLPGRVGLIVVVALFAVWLTFVAAGYVATGAGRDAALPTPERLAALAEVLERAAPAERALTLEAVSTRHFSASIATGAVETTRLPELGRVDAAALEAYREALAPRPLVVEPKEGARPLFYVMASALNSVEFRIGLAGGETLVIETESPLMVVPIGLPVGFGAAIIAVLVALVTLIALHREFRPLSRLAAAVDRVDPAGEAVALPQIRARSPELRALVAAFERLQERLTTLIRARMALVGGIQHDLRTFATRLRLRIDKIADPDDRARAAADIADMIALLDDALLASRAGASELDEELIELAALVASEVADRRAAGAPVTLDDGEDAAGTAVLGDRLALRRIVANLIDNALRYGHAAHLTLRAEGPDVVLLVDDEGPGIPMDQRALLLEPFTRTETSRARRTGGAGLGLAVVRSLAEAHGGRVEIDDAPAGGARLVIRLPLFLPADDAPAEGAAA